MCFFEGPKNSVICENLPLKVKQAKILHTESKKELKKWLFWYSSNIYKKSDKNTYCSKTILKATKELIKWSEQSKTQKSDAHMISRPNKTWMCTRIY